LLGSNGLIQFLYNGHQLFSRLLKMLISQAIDYEATNAKSILAMLRSIRESSSFE
jgi:hypothetical protein